MRSRDLALAVLVTVIWGLSFPAIKIALDGFSPAQLVVMRFAVACLPVLFLARPALPWPPLILIGLTLFTGQFLLLFFAFSLGVPSGVAAVTQQTHVFFTVLLAALFLRDIPTARQTIGMAVAFGGLALIGLTADSDLTFLGLGLALAGAFSWAVGNVLVKRSSGVAMLPLMAWASLVPPLPALAVSAWLDPDASLMRAVANASWPSLLAALYLGAVATPIAYAIWGGLLGRNPAAAVAPFALLAPCVGILSSAMIFGEAFPPIRYVGMTLILLGLAAVMRAPSRGAAVIARDS